MTSTNKPLRVLVFGGRDFGEVPFQGPIKDTAAYRAAKARADFQHDLLRRKLDEVCIDDGEMLPRAGTVIIHGKAKRGADRLADEWAVVNWTGIEEYEADWSLGRKAGPLRNQRMLAEGRPDYAVGFPTGGPGSANMIMLLRAHGIPFVLVEAPLAQG